MRTTPYLTSRCVLGGIILVLLLAAFPQALASPAASSQSPNDTEVAGLYVSVQTVSQTFYQNISGFPTGQSSPARFSSGIPLPYVTETSVAAVLTVSAPRGYSAVADVIQTPTTLYDSEVPYQTALYGIVVNGSRIVETTTNLSNNSTAKGPPVGSYSLTISLSLTISYTQDFAAVWVQYPNDSYSYALQLAAPSTGTLNFTAYISAAGVTIPFPTTINLTSVQVYFCKTNCLSTAKGIYANFTNYQWTYGSATLVPPSLAASAEENFTVWVKAAPVTTGYIPLLSFSSWAASGTVDVSTVTYYNNHTYTYAGYFIIDYSLPYAISISKLSILSASGATTIPPNEYATSTGVITLLPGSVTVAPGSVVTIEVSFTFQNTPPAISIYAGYSPLGLPVTYGEITVGLIVLTIIYFFYVLVTNSASNPGRTFKTREAWLERLLETVALLVILSLLYLFELKG